MSLHTLYAIVDLVLAVLLALALWPLVRLPRWTDRLRDRVRDGGAVRSWRVTTRIAWELGLPIALLGGARFLLHLAGAQSWAEGLALLPDTGTWLWALCLTVLVTGALRLVAVLRVARRMPSVTRRAMA
jgi:hypothetical protein